MQRIFLILIALQCSLMLSAQPKRSRLATNTVQRKAAEKTTAKTTSDRAELMFPTSDAMPEDVVWRRDIYRQLDLLKDANAPLYYPVEPHGKEQNLFTYLFRLFVSGRIPAYTYKLDGKESFEEKDKADARELLERYSIYFEEANGKVTVPESDIPSAEVTRYYIKESNYFDQRSATYKTRVTALCPVLMRGADDFGTEATPYPLFWINYDDVAAYLSRMPLMASNLNNVTNMTVDDYFTMNRYEGKIYKTNNLQGKVLANYCPTDSAMTKEQKRIEQQLEDFENHIWHQPVAKDSLDSVAVAKDADKKVKQKTKSETKEKTSRRSKAEATQSRRSSASSAPRVSARRQRR